MESNPASVSKVVDENGEPMPVYHGTTANFTVFDIDGHGGGAAYFARDKEYAESHYGNDASAMACYLNLRKPLTAQEAFDRYGLDFSELNEQESEGVRKKVNRAKADGYDGMFGVTFDDAGIEQEAVAAFSPTQIKSATDNTGAFDPQNPDIRFKRGESLAPELRDTLTFQDATEATAKASVRGWRAERKVFTNRRSGREAEFKSDWTKIFSEPAKKKSASYAAHYAAANRLDSLFENGVKMWDEPPRNGSRDIHAYAKYGCPFELDGETYLAKITVKEYADNAARDGFYSIEAISVEKINAGGINAGITSVKGHELDPGATAVLKQMLQQTGDIVAQTAPEAQGGVRFKRSGLYTGSAADYDKPSLHAVGTGEGSQVYGWGLYASSVRSVAEGYAKAGVQDKASTPDELWPKYKGKFEAELEYDPVRSIALKYVKSEGSVDEAIHYLRTNKFTEDAIPKMREAAEWLEANREDVTPPKVPPAHVYEQTFFTDRAEGDESHLLNWYEPVSEENKRRVADALAERYPPNDRRFLYLSVAKNGAELYGFLSKSLGSPKAASEFLARAGIDGVKYPVDSYGKTVKDGDKVGWNYVSFRDDNITVDHKWHDGQMLFKRGDASRYGIGSSAVNGKGFADLEAGDTYEKVFRSLTSRTNEEVRNETLGITAKIGSNRNANHLVGKNSAFGDEDAEAHKYAAKNVLALLAKADVGILHRDKKGTRNDYIRAFAPFAFGDGTNVATITLRRESAGDRIYTVEAVEVESGDSPRTSRRTAQEAQSPVSLRDRIAYYVGDVKATKPRFLGSETPFSVDALAKRISDSVATFRQNTERNNIRFKRGEPNLPRATEDDPNVAFGTKEGIFQKTGIEREFARVSDVAVMREGERRSRIVGEADGIIRRVQRGEAPSSTDLATLIHTYADTLAALDRARNGGEDTEMLEKAVENVAEGLRLAGNRSGHALQMLKIGVGLSGVRDTYHYLESEVKAIKRKQGIFSIDGKLSDSERQMLEAQAAQLQAVNDKLNAELAKVNERNADLETMNRQLMELRRQMTRRIDRADS